MPIPTANALKYYKILMIDADREMGGVLKDMLQEMGFTNVRLLRDSKEAMRSLARTQYDFVITEWNTLGMNGIQFIKQLRSGTQTAAPALPVIMLSGRAEINDVLTARDVGVNEYVVKPFTARSIYNRIERLIERPKHFVISPVYIGPDRRAKKNASGGENERRQEIAPQLAPGDLRPLVKSAAKPQLFLPSFALKTKLGRNIHLDTLITEDVLNMAQAAIDAAMDDALQWIRSDIREIEDLYLRMVNGEDSGTFDRTLTEAVLAFNGRAGTFGYARASEIAYQLYLFCSLQLKPDSAMHHLIVRKHIDVLKIILANQLGGNGGDLGGQIVTELKQLIQKYA